MIKIGARFSLQETDHEKLSPYRKYGFLYFTRSNCLRVYKYCGKMWLKIGYYCVSKQQQQQSRLETAADVVSGVVILSLESIPNSNTNKQRISY